MNIINSAANIYQFPKINTRSIFKTLPFKGAGNLAPLERDTVSFSGKSKSKEAPETSSEINAQDDKNFEHSDRISLKLAQNLYNESKYAYGLLRYALSKILDTDAIDITSPDYQKQIDAAKRHNHNKPILAITCRRKKPESISEKMAENKLKSKKSAKEELHDLIGARIILTGNSTKEGDYVLDKLSEAVAKRRIKIKSIKNHGQENTKTKYATKRKIDKLINTARKSGSPLCSYSDKPRNSGYLAMHIILEDVADGYEAEIQIMDANVEKFKELEDICYKCTFNKNSPKKYAPIAKLLGQVHSSPALRKEFLEYTKRAYEFERLQPYDSNEYTHHYFPIPKDLNIPKELDFNNLAKIKDSIDDKQRSEQG